MPGLIFLLATDALPEERAFALVSEKSPELPEAERREIARAVGIGAVQYADLCQNRSSNYVVSWDKMLALYGKTAPYLLYAIARIRSRSSAVSFEGGGAGWPEASARSPGGTPGHRARCWIRTPC